MSIKGKNVILLKNELQISEDFKVSLSVYASSINY